MATKKRQYHYIVTLYKVEKNDGGVEYECSTFLCSTNETCPAGIPTMGYMVRRAKLNAELHGNKYVDGSLYISSLIKLTKAQYDALMDKKEVDEL